MQRLHLENRQYKSDHYVAVREPSAKTSPGGSYPNVAVTSLLASQTLESLASACIVSDH